MKKNMQSPTNMLRPRILILVTQYELAGAQKAAISQAQYLHTQGYPVTLCFFYDYSGGLSGLRKRVSFPVINLEARPQRFGKLGQFAGTLRASLRLLQLLRHQQIQVILTFTHYSNVLGIPLAWLAGVPVRISGQRNTLSLFPAWFWRIDAAIANSALTSVMVAVSEETRRFSIDVERIRTEKLVVIPNGVDVAAFDRTHWAASERESLRTQFGIPADAPLILTVARLFAQKGHRYLLDAALHVWQRHPQAHFVWVGAGDLHDALTKQIIAAGAQDRIHLAGRRSDVPYLLASADLFVLPSVSEGMPNVILEAMAASLPIVATAVDGTRELIQDGVTGRLVPPRDSAALATAISDMLDQPATATRLAHQAHAFVQEHYADTAMYARLVALITQYTQPLVRPPHTSAL